MSTVMNLRKRVEAIEDRLDALEVGDSVVVTDDAPDTRTADELVDDYTRAELDDLARDAGVDDPDALDNKSQVAEAIVAARDGGA